MSGCDEHSFVLVSEPHRRVLQSGVQLGPGVVAKRVVVRAVY